MPRKRSIAPRACKVLWEGDTPQQNTAAEPFALPASFPADILEDDQLEAVQDWWDGYATDMLNGLRAALVCARTRSTKDADAWPVTLQNLQLHAVMLAHLLRLHPSAEDSLPKLAAALGVAVRRMYYVRDAVLEQLGQPVVAAFRATRAASDSTLEQLTTDPRLNFDAAKRHGLRSWYIPYTGHTTTMQRFAIVAAVADKPGVAIARDDFMPGTTTHCLFVSLKS